MQLGGILGAGLFVLSGPPTLLHQRAGGLASHLLEAPGSFGLTASSSCSPTHGPTSPEPWQQRRTGDPEATREVAQSREAETWRAMGAPFPETCGSPGPPSRSRRRTGLQHPRGRLQKQREPHRGQSSAAPLHTAPACAMPLLYPKPNPLQKANLCSRLFFW